MTSMIALPADDPGLPVTVERMLAGGPPVAPLPTAPASTLEMLQPDVPVAEEDAGLIIGTSGSTGTPKGVVLSRRAILGAVDATHARLGGVGNWTLAVPAHYVAGIMVMARAVASGSTLFRAAPDLSDLPRLAGGVSGRHYLSLVPTQLIRALEHRDILERLACYDAILLGGAAADPGLLERAAETGLHVITTYGSSETAGGCVYDGVPLNGVTVELREDAGHPPSGRIAITGEVVFSGYRLRPELTAEVLTGRTLLTRDRGEWSDGRLRILGRLDDVVVSGGVNVDLAGVEKALQEIDPHAAALGVPDPEWGTLVVAALTLPATLSDVRARLAALAPAARPRGLLRYSHLPRTSSGKIDRQALLSWWDEGPADKEQM